jgi:signal transduction histidine kinase
VDPEPEQTYERLRSLAVHEPRKARDLLVLVVSAHGSQLAPLLELASRPGEGRIRQIVATTMRVNPDVSDIFRPWLERWLALEDDEFAVRAIREALAVVASPTTRNGETELPRNFAETYRYVSERLCHRVRNSLSAPDTALFQLELLLPKIQDPSVRTRLEGILADLQSGIHRISRMVEFDQRDGYMSWSSIDLHSWVLQAAANLNSRYGSLRLVIRSTTGARTRIRATPFLLDVIFGNLWSNA